MNNFGRIRIIKVSRLSIDDCGRGPGPACMPDGLSPKIGGIALPFPAAPHPPAPKKRPKTSALDHSAIAA